jgi:hypothetical protein
MGEAWRSGWSEGHARGRRLGGNPRGHRRGEGHQPASKEEMRDSRGGMHRRHRIDGGGHMGPGARGLGSPGSRAAGSRATRPRARMSRVGKSESVSRGGTPNPLPEGMSRSVSRDATRLSEGMSFREPARRGEAPHRPQRRPTPRRHRRGAPAEETVARRDSYDPPRRLHLEHVVAVAGARVDPRRPLSSLSVITVTMRGTMRRWRSASRWTS